MKELTALGGLLCLSAGSLYWIEDLAPGIRGVSYIALHVWMTAGMLAAAWWAKRLPQSAGPKFYCLALSFG